MDHLERQPPFDADAELATLGSMVVNPLCIDDVLLVASQDDFYLPEHAILFAAIIALDEDPKSKVDAVPLVSRLKDTGSYEQVGGGAYIARLFDSVPNAAHAKHYATIVRGKAIQRRLIRAGTSIVKLGFTDDSEPHALLGQAESVMQDLGDSCVDREREPREAFDVFDEVLQRLEQTDRKRGVLSGFIELDKILGGFRPGTLTVLAARPGEGKSALAANIAEYVSLAKLRTLIISLEMSEEELSERMACSLGRVDSLRMREGTATREERKKFAAGATQLAGATLALDDNPSYTASQIASTVRRYKRHHGELALIVVDYCQLIEPEDHRLTRQQQLGKITRRMKGVARESETPIILLAQLNRLPEKEKRKPRLSDLREAGDLENDADVVMFLHHPAKLEEDKNKRREMQGKVELLIEKHRNGPTGIVHLTWIPHFTRFENAAQPYQVVDGHAEFDAWNSQDDFGDPNS